MDATAAVGICTLIGTYCDCLTDFARRASAMLPLRVVASSFHRRWNIIQLRSLPSSMRSGV